MTNEPDIAERFHGFRLRSGGVVDLFELRQAAIEAARLCDARGDDVELVELRAEDGEDFEVGVEWKAEQ